MKNWRKRPHVFIATTGNNPQVVTLGLDLLLAHNQFVEVCVIHTAIDGETPNDSGRPSKMEDAVARLDQQFLNKRSIEERRGDKRWLADYKDSNGRFHQFTYRRVLIQREEQEPGQLATAVPAFDIETEENAHAAFRTIYRTVKRYKEQRAVIHFNLAGGRKSMSVFAMSSAQILFTPGDKLWHVISNPNLIQTNEMHDPSNESQLVPIPFISVSTLNPVLGLLASSGDPYDMVQAQEEYLHVIDMQRKERFLRALDFDEYQILVGVAQGLSNDEIGERLKKRLAGKTVANKLTTIYETYIVSIMEMPTAVSRPNHENLRAFLAAEFGAYFQQRRETL